MGESENSREKSLSSEEEDLMQRSNKKVKRTPENSPAALEKEHRMEEDAMMETFVEETMEDGITHSHGPWIIGDSYLTIRKWISNFVADEAPIKFLTAWVRIPNLSIEYFGKEFLHKIGSKIGKVVNIDRNTEAKKIGQYIRFSIEVDVTKPLLSKFRLNGRIWRIQYEGLRQICFKCGKLGHKDNDCELKVVQDNNGENVLEKQEEIVQESFIKPRP
ncbi:uncharacterized protein At4g02000-like [Chenopodium quinoa]|uniref:uncharacterized protein At4g02000-like n=1 Tax=Chenopodium quinoa TaxID=63459 RepID=UPI000B787CC8|nr:uncharacterized protein At4g02000-like [Chenopodium quinoa]